MHPGVVGGCIALIVVGVAVIMYTLFRTPKTPARFGDRPSIDLGEEVPDEQDETEAEEAEAEESTEENDGQDA